MRGQELLNGDVRVDPPAAGTSREARVLVRISDPKIAQLYADIQHEFDVSPIGESDAFWLCRKVMARLDAFFGRKRK